MTTSTPAKNYTPKTLANDLAGAYRAVRKEYERGFLDYLDTVIIVFDNGKPEVIVATNTTEEGLEVIAAEEAASSLDDMLHALQGMADTLDLIYISLGTTAGYAGEVSLFVQTKDRAPIQIPMFPNLRHAVTLHEEDFYIYGGYDADGYDRNFLDYDGYNEAGEFERY